MFSKGDTVHVKTEDSPVHAGTYTVVKTNPTTYLLERIGSTNATNLKAPHGMVHAGSLSDSDPAPTTGAFPPGTVVTVNGVRGVNSNTLYVVTGTTAKGYRIFKLGGDTRYYTNVSASRLVRVTRIDGWSQP